MQKCFGVTLAASHTQTLRAFKFPHELYKSSLYLMSTLQAHYPRRLQTVLRPSNQSGASRRVCGLVLGHGVGALDLHDLLAVVRGDEVLLLAEVLHAACVLPSVGLVLVRGGALKGGDAVRGGAACGASPAAAAAAAAAASACCRRCCPNAATAFAQLMLPIACLLRSLLAAVRLPSCVLSACC